MTLVDTTDGVVMAGAYGWAFVEPRRKLVYNLAVTSISIVLALVIAMAEVLGLMADRLGLAGRIWRWAGALDAHMGAVGCAIVALLLCCWGVSAVLGRSWTPALRGEARPR
jgi:high-affinity nickel-transport protein